MEPRAVAGVVHVRDVVALRRLSPVVADYAEQLVLAVPSSGSWATLSREHSFVDELIWTKHEDHAHVDPLQIS